MQRAWRPGLQNLQGAHAEVDPSESPSFWRARSLQLERLRRAARHLKIKPCDGLRHLPTSSRMPSRRKPNTCHCESERLFDVNRLGMLKSPGRVATAGHHVVSLTGPGRGSM